jgi:hypothetical protein
LVADWRLVDCEVVGTVDGDYGGALGLYVGALGGKAAEDDGKMVEDQDSKMDENWDGKAG